MRAFSPLYLNGVDKRVKLLGKYIRSYLKETILAPLFKMLEAALELIIPLIVSIIIDEGIPRGDTGFIIKYLF